MLVSKGLRLVAVRVLESLLGRLRRDEVPQEAQAPARPIAVTGRTDYVPSPEADAIEEEFRDLIHGLELNGGCGEIGCPRCPGHRYLN